MKASQGKWTWWKTY